MALLSAALDAEPDAFDLLGAPAQSSVLLRAAATVTPAVGSPTTIAAGTFAVLETAPTTPAVWDRSSTVMALYAKAGDTHLYAAAENDLATLTGDQALIARVLRHAVVPAQPASGTGGGATEAMAALEYVLDGGGSTLATGTLGSLAVPYDCTITACELLADVSGSLVLDIQKATYSAYPTTSSIVASAPPTITSAQKSQDSTLPGWTTSLTAGDVLVYSVTSASTIARCSVVLSVTRAIASVPGGGTGPANIDFAFDGAGATIATGVAGQLVVPFACTITSAELLADVSGSLVVDVWKSTYSAYPPSSANSICGSAKPTLSSAQKSQDTTLSGWTVALSAGDILVYNVVSASTVSHASLSLLVTRSITGGGGVVAETFEHNGSIVATRSSLNFIDGTGASLTVADNSTNNRVDVTVAATGGSEAIRHNGTLVGTRPTINLIDGTGTTLTVADNSGASRVDVTIASSGGGGGGGGGGSGGATSVLLDYAATTDIISGLSCPGSTWTDLISNLTFTVGSSTSVVELAVSGAIYVGGASSLGNAGLRAIIDSGGTPILKMLGGSRLPTSGDYNNLLEGCDVVTLTGLAAGSHTVKLQVNPSVAATAHCLVATQGDQYSLQVRVLEQSSAPVWRVLRPPSDATPQTGTYDIGSRFYVNADATCTGIMFYRETSDPLTSRTVRLWDDTSTQLASATTSGEAGTGWVTMLFSSPVSLTKATYYRAVAEYHDHRFDGGGFLPLGSGPLWIPNDVFTSTLGAFPSSGGAGNVNYRYVSPVVVTT